MSITDTTNEDLQVEDATPDAPVADPAAEAAVIEELLVEEVSIDGMCGVY